MQSRSASAAGAWARVAVAVRVGVGLGLGLGVSGLPVEAGGDDFHKLARLANAATKLKMPRHAQRNAVHPPPLPHVLQFPLSLPPINSTICWCVNLQPKQLRLNNNNNRVTTTKRTTLTPPSSSSSWSKAAVRVLAQRICAGFGHNDKNEAQRSQKQKRTLKLNLTRGHRLQRRGACAEGLGLQLK